MTREIRNAVTLVVDGREVVAPEGTMLVDAAKHGDVEIPVFCYEPKLGEPVGACRMCLVEIEGMPKLQTACSTPVRDGMVVYTQTDQVKGAQNAVVEFLLVNHPLDCPVCDKGGECPLQDIAMGWGPGRSRVVDPKRHFQKPLELSPLVAIDRERCILCYRCVRFSQEVSEDEQLQLLGRGDRSYVGTFDDRPYVAPFHGNIIELCPVGALTSYTYRFRARPWDIEQAGSVCTLCPSQCNVSFTVRDERVMRVLARDNAEVDDGWLCDKGRFGYQMIHSEERITEPMIREGGALRPASWGEALRRVAEGLEKAGAKAGLVLGGGSSNEEGWILQRIWRKALGSPHVASGAGPAPPRELLLELARPELAGAVRELDYADAILVVDADPVHSAPIVDLRIRKAVRRSGARLAVASARPTALDGGAASAARYAPGDGGAFLAALAGALGARGYVGEKDSSPYAEQAKEIADALEGARDSQDAIVVWGGGLAEGRDGALALEALLAVARALGTSERRDSGLLEVPAEPNARGLREVGCIPSAGPGLGATKAGKPAPEIRAALEDGSLNALLLFESNPVRDHPDSEGWRRALTAADLVVSVAMFEDASTALADVVLPAESHAEKDGTVTHPDGRLQRLRPSIPRPGSARGGWEWLRELSGLRGAELEADTNPAIFEALSADVTLYEGITLDEIGGRGVRWQDRRGAAARWKEAAKGTKKGGAGSRIGAIGGGGERQRADDEHLPRDGDRRPADDAAPGGRLTLGTYRDLWAGEVTERNPALRFLTPQQRLELAPADAERLGVAHGDEVTVSSNGTGVVARVAVRERMAPGAGFLIEGTAEGNANALADGAPRTVEVTKGAPE